MTGNPGWDRVDRLIGDTLLDDDEVLAGCVARSAAAGLRDISLTAAQARFLQLLAQVSGARRALEVGTLGGFSAIHLARGMGTDGRVITLEIDPHVAAVARENVASAGLSDRIEIIVGPALDSLPGLAGPFDLVFIDADKVNNANYVDHALRMSRPGTLIVVDNVVRDGAVLSPENGDDNAKATRALYDLVAADDRVEATAIQMVGEKGWDGMMFLRVRD